MNEANVILKIRQGGSAGAKAPLEPGSYTIGTDEFECDIILHDDGIEPRHAVLSVAEDCTMSLEVLQGAAVEIDGRLLGSGCHVMKDGAIVRMGGSLLALAQVSPGELPQQPRAIASASPRRIQRTATWITGVLCTVGACAAVLAAVSGTASSDGSAVNTQRVNPLLARQGRSEAAAAGTVRQFGAVATPGNGRPLPLGKGTLLIDPPSPPSGADSSGATTESIELQVTALHVDGADAPFIETSTGQRYEIGATLPGGYTLVSLSREGLVLARGDARIIYSMQ